MFNRQDGTKYEGAFSDNVPHGKGALFFPDGSVIKGEWNKGVFIEKSKH